MSNRIEYLDIAKGIGILLVVLGHNDFEVISPFIHKVIYSFHIPLFFFLSGYFLNASLPFIDFVKKRFHSLLKPYLFTLFLIYFTSVSFEKMGFRTALGRIVKSLYASGIFIDWVQLWFLPHLFVVSIYAYVFFTVFAKPNRRTVRWIVLVASLGVASLFLTSFFPILLSIFGKDYELPGLPFSLDLTLLSGFYFILGSEIRQVTSGKTFENLFLLAGAGIGLLLLNYFFFESFLDFNVRRNDSFPINTVLSILGILFILALSRQIELRTTRLASLFKYFGKITLIILIFHVPAQAFWSMKTMTVTNDNFPLSLAVGFVMGVAVPVLIYELFIKENPVASFWFGRQAELPENKEPSSLSAK